MNELEKYFQKSLQLKGQKQELRRLAVKKGKIDFKVDKSGIIHASVGKVSFDSKKIEENANELLNTVMKLKPSSSKGVYFKSINLSSTMSGSIKIDSSALIS